MRVSSPMDVSRWAFAVIGLVAMSATAAAANDADNDLDSKIERTLQMIVMLNAEFEGGTPESGAGIIFGRDRDRLFVATAYHVVHRGGELPKQILVRFKTAPQKQLPAVLLKHADQAGPDLAVLSVVGLEKAGISIGDLPWDALGTPTELKRGDEALAIGNPNGINWAVPVSPDAVSGISEVEIVFQSSFISAGNSGGGLLDGQAKILGMVIADQPPFGRAIRIDAILKRTTAWGLPAQLQVRQKNGVTPLHLAAESGDLRALESLLDDYGDPSAPDDDGVTPLHLAAKFGRVDAMKLLLRRGAKRDAVDTDGDPPLLWAVGWEQTAAVRCLIQAGAAPRESVTEINGQERHPRFLTTALEPVGRKLEIVQLLVGAGADVRNSSYQQPLLTVVDELGRDARIAQTEKHAELPQPVVAEGFAIIRYLVEHGAKVSDEELEKAVDWERDDILAMLLEFKPDVSADSRELVESAIKGDHPEMAKRLVLAGAGKNPKRLNWAFFLAVTNHQHELAEFLLSRGAEVKELEEGLKDEFLTRAVENRWLDIVRVALADGANPNRKYTIYTPFEIARRNGDQQILAALQKAAPELNPPD